MNQYRLVSSVLIAMATLATWPVHAAGREVEVSVNLDPAQGQLPESVSGDQEGNLYLAINAQVWRVRPNWLHTCEPPELVAPLPAATGAMSAGLKVGFDGNIYAATSAFDPSLDASRIWRVSPQGDVEEYAHFDPHSFPNDLAFDDDGTMFVTDASLGRIYKVKAAGDFSTWIESPDLLGKDVDPVFVIAKFGADGIAFDRGDRHLYIGNLDYGRIYKVHVRHDGSPGPLQLFAEDSNLLGVDGLAFNVVGDLFCAVNSQNQVVKINRFGQVSVVASGGALDGPSSLFFGNQWYDRHVLYISSFAIGEALGIVPGTPRPSVDWMWVGFPGLPVP